MGHVELGRQHLDQRFVRGTVRGRSAHVDAQLTVGAYAVERGATVLQVLSLAGGVTDRGSEGRIKVLRTVKTKKTEIKVKLTDTVEPGDTIVVPERFF